MKKSLLTIIIILVFLVGLGIMLYPLVSDYINAQNQSRAIARYYEDIEDISLEDYAAAIELAHQYNQTLMGKPNRYVLTDEEHAEYMNLLNLSSNGVMGVLEIDVIGVSLPIYHGTEESALQIGVGHFEGTSLPVGGLGTHAVLTGHTGLPRSTLLTDLDQVVVGDTFRVRVLNETLTYEIDQIAIVLPHETDELEIRRDQDYCTIVTCTPYGVNSHRRMVRGTRIANEEVPETEEIIRRVVNPVEVNNIGPIIAGAVLVGFAGIGTITWLVIKMIGKKPRK